MVIGLCWIARVRQYYDAAASSCKVCRETELDVLGKEGKRLCIQLFVAPVCATRDQAQLTS